MKDLILKNSKKVYGNTRSVRVVKKTGIPGALEHCPKTCSKNILTLF